MDLKTIMKRAQKIDLYCPKCTRNITKTAQLFEIGDELSPDNQKHFVLWVPLFTPFKFLSTLSGFTTNPIAENNSSNPNHSVENNSSDPNFDGSVDKTSSNLSSNETVDKNSSIPNPNHLAKMLELLPTLFRKSRVGAEENNVTNKEKDNIATPSLHQQGKGHQSSTSTSGKIKTSGIYAECEQHRHFVTRDEGWHYHHH